MAGKRIRIDLEDKDGAKYKFNLEGNINRDKVLKIFDLLDLMNIEETTDNPGVESVGGKIWHIVDKYYPTGKFTSSDILEKYEDEFNEPIKLSVISTYLARFTSKNKVERAKKGREWAYNTLKLTNTTPKLSEN
ncbi:MAG TPA: hypothetical protein QGF44_01165 [Candidatus Nitrosopelagicus sp.]|nr:hypothetical protein [Candidatus Nitrosopelagicus sp.]